MFQKSRLTAPGIGLFTGGHLLWLAAICAFTALCCLLARRGRAKALRRWLGAAAPALELVRVLALALTGNFGLGWLPLHLCGLSIFLVLWHSLRPGALGGELLYCLGLPGAAFALIFPDWTAYPAWNLLCILCFLLHAVLVAYPAAMVSCGEINPSSRRLPACFLILLAAAGLVWLVDLRLDMNFMFLIRPAPSSPLEWFAGFLGPRAYVLGYLPMIAGVWLILYLPPALLRRRRKES